MTQVNGIKSGETKQTLELKAKQEIAWKSGVDLFSNLAGITSKEEQKAVVDIVKNADFKFIEICCNFDNEVDIWDEIFIELLISILALNLFF